LAQVSVSVAFYAYISAAWVELDTSHPYRAAWGMSDNNPTSRLADVGEFTLALNNSTGQYTVGGPSALAGWKKQLPFKMEITFAGEVRKRWRGYISDIQIRPGTKDKKAYITVVEWLDYASRHPIVNPGIQTDKRGDEVLTTVVGEVEIQPQATDFDTGVETFPAAFDTVTSKTKAYTEFAKVALSEIGMVYEIHDLTYGETIRFENATARHGWIAPAAAAFTTVTVDPNPGFALNEDGGFALNEDGGQVINDDVITTNYSFDGTMDDSVISDFDAPYGEHVINRMTAQANPRRLSSFSIGSETVRTNLAADSEMVSTSPTTNYSTAVEMVVGEWFDVAATHRSWIKPSFAGILAEGARIQSAKLVLFPLEVGSTNARTMRAHRCLRAVVESQITWNIYSTGNNWGTAGCSNSTTDYDGAIEMGNMAVPATPTLHVPIEMNFSTEGVEELQKMYDGTYTNNGIILFMDTQLNDATDYWTIEGDIAFRPYLEIIFGYETLFQLDEEIIIGSGQTIIIKGNYINQLSGLPATAQNMISPVETEDYTMFTATDGGGTNISSDLSVTPSYGAEGFEHSVTNNNANVGYINKFNCRGTGIYLFNPIEHAATNAASVAEYGTESETLNQKYKNDLYSSSVFADSVVDEHRQPRTVLNSISFCANSSPSNMMAFLYTEIGDMRYISITEAGIAGNYYIQGIEFTMSGGIIMVKWIVVLALSLQAGLSPLAVEFAGGAATDGINYGYLPAVSGDQITNKGFSAWIYVDAVPTVSEPETIFSSMSTSSGPRVEIYNGAGNIGISYYSPRNGIYTSANVLTINTWYHVLVAYNNGSVGNVPLLYVNAVAKTLTEDYAPGALVSEVGNVLTLGNTKIASIDYTHALNGKIFDPRFYNMNNTTLTAAQLATALYNVGVPSVTLATDGLVFQGFNVRTGDLASYVGTTLTSAYTLRDNLYGAVGVPNGSPVGRAAP